MNTCKFLGIYADAIEAAADDCEAAMEKLGFSLSEIDDMYDFAKQDFEEIGSLSDITNSVISCLFRSAETSIHEKYPGLRVDYYVNCHDSSFDVEDLPDPMTEGKIRADWESALATMDYYEISEAIEWGFYPEDLRKLMQLHRAGERRNKIEDLLTDCNFHSFCACLSDGDYAGAEKEIREMEEED